MVNQRWNGISLAVSNGNITVKSWDCWEELWQISGRLDYPYSFEPDQLFLHSSTLWKVCHIGWLITRTLLRTSTTVWGIT